MRVSTVPNAMETAPARPAATPTGSSAAFGVNTNSATPAVPQIAPMTAINRIGLPSRAAEMNTTISGCTAPTVAATRPAGGRPK
ncbi:hypothetical protein ECZU12_52000 [Escherichia coli]|nr:hypothetical protein ECZU12_52000 [Escherichia coli]